MLKEKKMANLPNNPTLSDMKQFINQVVNSVSTGTRVDEDNEKLILSTNNITISTAVAEN